MRGLMIAAIWNRNAMCRGGQGILANSIIMSHSCCYAIAVARSGTRYFFSESAMPTVSVWTAYRIGPT